MNKSSTRHKIIACLAFFAIYTIWGSTYLAILFALEGMGPFVLSALRFLSAGALLLLWVLTRRIPFPAWKDLPALMLSGIMMLVGGNAFVVYGEQYVDSGYAAVIVATEPLWFVLLDKRNWHLYFSGFEMIGGLLLGFVGILLFTLASEGPSYGLEHLGEKIQGTLIVLASAVMWVWGTVFTRDKLRGNRSNAMDAAIQMLTAGAGCGLVCLLNGEWNAWHIAAVSPKAWSGLLFLVVMGSLIAFMAFTWLIRNYSLALVSTHTYVNPMIALFLGGTIMGEQINKFQLLAFLLVLAGVAITLRKGRTQLS